MRLNPEQARLLRDKERGLQRPHPYLPQSGLRKHREIRFAKLPPNQANYARQLLAHLPNIELVPGALPNCLSVVYDVTEYTLEGLEAALSHSGLHLDSSLLAKLIRALVYFSEETQLRNMAGPQRLIKKSHEIYCQAWEHHPHGDRDETPPELRVDR